MNIIIFGPQGCGKGTQSRMIADKHKLYHLSMGDELRAESKSKPAITKMLNDGVLVPDSISNGILMKMYKKHKKGLILDGYPRRLSQLQFIVKQIPINVVIEIHITEKESMRRMLARRVCPKCRRYYNTIFLKPKKEGLCDVCKVKLIHREDDKPEEIKRRIAIYHEETEPLRKYYSKADLLYVVNGERSIKEVNQDIESILKRINKS